MLRQIVLSNWVVLHDIVQYFMVMSYIDSGAGMNENVKKCMFGYVSDARASDEAAIIILNMWWTGAIQNFHVNLSFSPAN